MDALGIAKESVKTLWTHKRLWVFGLFVAGGSGGGASFDEGAAAGGSGVEGIAGWVVALIVGAVVLGLVGLFMHVVSESALIHSVRDARGGGEPRLGPAFRRGVGWFGRLLGIKVLAFVTALVSVAVVAVPAVLGALEVWPLWLGAGLTALLALPAVPWLLTVYFVYEWAMRFAVLEDRGAIASLRAAERFLHGRIAASLKLLVMDALGQVVSGLAALVVAVAAGLVGLGVYFAAGLVPAIVVGVVMLLPFAVAITGARGVYSSSLWTLGWLEERGGRI